ncbi:heterokaryon incompatibility protein-domain-containing protein [Rostrohypoxylon terebratum]|nr:heterokaryon incompatibility protein-domain-containing protein [Rostrohypoxylon terebratum]
MLDLNQELDLLAARSSIPELVPLHLPQNWRADEAKSPKDRCATCDWDGCWNSIAQWQGRSQFDSPQNMIRQVDLEQSFATTACFSCAVLLALTRKLSVLTGGFGGIWFSRYYDLMISNDKKADVEIYISCESEEAPDPPGAKVYTHKHYQVAEPWSEETLAWANDHIDNCIQNHDCSSFRLVNHLQSLPTRLLHIPGNANINNIRLIRDTTSLPQNTRYSALSHCWGKEKPRCITTVHNIGVHSTEGIPWEVIPQTFKDAMQYTRRLGLEYIWIDSFCIIQNDLPDWENESVRMFSYYSNAYITLGSTFSVDCTGGFFSERHIRVSRLHLFDVFFQDTKLGVYASPRKYKNESLDLNESSTLLGRSDSPYHLFKRAWTYQERLVSQRLLLFTEDRVLFECYSGRRSQEGESVRSTTLKESYRHLLTSKAYESEQELWTLLVHSFTVLQLSVFTDKLPAFAAIAQQYLSRQSLSCAAEDEYLCGLRKSYLHCDLLWQATLSQTRDREIDDERFCIGNSYLAPSWSWASVPRSTCYADTMVIPAGTGFGGSTITFKGECLDFTKSGRFGRVLGGYIIIEGPVLNSYMQVSPGRDLNYYHSHELVLKNGWQLEFWPDFKRGYKHFGLADKVEVYLLLVWASEQKGAVLALHKNSENHRYYRLGISFFGLTWSDNRWPYLHGQFKNAERRTLEIE